MNPSVHWLPSTSQSGQPSTPASWSGLRRASVLQHGHGIQNDRLGPTLPISPSTLACVAVGQATSVSQTPCQPPRFTNVTELRRHVLDDYDNNTLTQRASSHFPCPPAKRRRDGAATTKSPNTATPRNWAFLIPCKGGVSTWFDRAGRSWRGPVLRVGNHFDMGWKVVNVKKKNLFLVSPGDAFGCLLHPPGLRIAVLV